MSKRFLGEFEQMVLIALLRLGDEAYGPGVAEELERRAGRQVSRGALYATLDRLEQKGLLRWEIEAATSESSGNRRRRFELIAPKTRGWSWPPSTSPPAPASPATVGTTGRRRSRPSLAWRGRVI